MQWIGPLFTNAAGWKAYVSFAEGKWYIKHDGSLEIGKGRSGLMLLPILEKGYGECYQHQIDLLKRGLRESGLDEACAETFPFKVPVLFPFQHHMSNWADDASDWLWDIELTHAEAELLFAASQNKQFRQKTRHRLRQRVNAWTAQQGVCFVREKL
ncbi:hypothetical protein ONV78_08485 [Hahella sp. CR1]|uniref:hypothetical protein n=1 Tax=Hahella sp. CR1 TaxID=2992807 RepID=UPI002443622B|nr:hypothetical protein [Hahella sp. CR1]MDG9667765.1 hypothetical protein [Hahella sp. CR1]